jgi:hypothetical protein
MMLVSEVPKGGFRRGWHAYVLAAGIGAVGLLMMHHPMILSGLRRVQVGLGDSRLINYFLEHNYLWYCGAPGHAAFWDPPFFYPARNIAAYSDTMLGIAPVYAAFRVVGFAPDTSFQLWMIALSALNYLVMVHFLRRRVGVSVFAASIGAFLFAYGSPRLNMMGAPQQLPQFLSLITADALFGLFAGPDGPWYTRAGLWLVAAAGLLAQLSSGFYIGWFMVLSLAVVAALALRMPSTRGPFLAVLRRDAPWVVATAILGALAIRPWLAHHLAAAGEVGPRSTMWVYLLMPRLSCWLDTGPENWVGGWTEGLTGLPGFKAEGPWTPLGVGLTTTAVALAGLYLGRCRASTRLLATASVILFLCLTQLPAALVPVAGTLSILVAVAFAYSARRDRPRPFLLVVGLVLLTVTFKGFSSEYLTGCGLYTLSIAVAAFVGRGEDRARNLALGALVVGLSFILLPFPVLGLGAVFGCLLAAATAVSGWRSRAGVEAVALGATLLFAGLMTYWSRPTEFSIALAAPVALVIARLSPVRPPDRFLPDIAFAGLAVLVMFVEGSAWNFFYLYVPGANALVFIARVALIMLIPAAIGIAFTLDALMASRRPTLALGLGLICLLEQGATTDSFDKDANREEISSLAQRIDGRAEAFYYSPNNERRSPSEANLDAMWAGLGRGRPTINGYSGHTPYAWRALETSKLTGPDDLARLELAVKLWRDGPGHAVGSLQWIGGPGEKPKTTSP